MGQIEYPTHLSASQIRPQSHVADRACIRDAVQVIMDEQSVSEIRAYAILVDASVDAEASVRETAIRLLTRPE